MNIRIIKGCDPIADKITSQIEKLCTSNDIEFSAITNEQFENKITINIDYAGFKKQLAGIFIKSIFSFLGRTKM